MKRLILFLCLLTILGCSGASMLIVDNKTSQNAVVTIKTEELKPPKPKKGQRRQWAPEEQEKTFDLPAGQDVDSKIWWFMDPPNGLHAEVTLGGKTLRRSWTGDQYPPGMAQGTSGGAFFFLEIHDDSLTLRDPTGWDKFHRNPQYYFLFWGSCLCPVILFIVLAFVVRRTLKVKAGPPASQ